MTKTTPDQSATALIDLLSAHRITAVLYVAARLGVADILATGARTGRALAEHTGAHERSLLRLMRALVAVGVCKQTGDGAFELTPVGAHLAASALLSLKPWAIFEGAGLTRSWADLLDSIRSGKTGAELAGFENTFDMMGKNPQVVAMFNDAMAAMTRTVIPEVLAAYDFTGVRRLMDVGGGYGELLSAILQAYPSMRGVVFDLPRCADGATKRFASSGLADRAEFIAGSFFESVPSGADAIVMKSIIHDWSDEQSVTILKNCRQALPPDGRLLLVERLMPEQPQQTPEHVSVTLSDLNMLRGPGGAERTESEYRDLLGQAGFALAHVVCAGRASVVEGRIA
jgi:SAM-dependent methyltransferase